MIIILRAQFGKQRTVSLIFLFTIESRLLEKRRDSLVDRIFNDKFGETAGKGQIARLDGIKRKRVVFISGCSSH